MGRGGPRLSVFVTVGMGPWPFDRLVGALAPLCARHVVFAQTGTATVAPPCPHRAVLPPHEVLSRIAEADVVITHAGNTVRLVQRAGKVPIVVAREKARGEMRNDHQRTFLAAEQARRRVVALEGDLDGLAAVVHAHPQVEQHLLATGSDLPQPDTHRAGELLDGVLSAAAPGPDNPFARHPLRRYAWAFAHLAGRAGRHLDLGIGDGVLTAALATATRLSVIGSDPHPGYLAQVRAGQRALPLVRAQEQLPFRDRSFASVSMLDSLEHTPDDARTLREVSRVLQPGGLLVLTVPARHIFSALDPDNAKLRHPRLHRAVYTARFGASQYHRRFVDDTDGLRGDLAWSRPEHTNYRPGNLLALLRSAGLQPTVRDGANLLWRFLQVPRLLGPAALAMPLDAAARWDGIAFHRANLFVTAEKLPG